MFIEIGVLQKKSNNNNKVGEWAKNKMHPRKHAVNRIFLNIKYFALKVLKG